MGGRALIDPETGHNPVQRIPTNNLREVVEKFYSKFGKFFSAVEFVSSPDLTKKEDHGDVDLVAIPVHKDSRSQFRTLLSSLNAALGPNWYQAVGNGRMDHVAFPLSEEQGAPVYQVDVIWTKDENDFKNKVFFYSNPITFNAILGHFARSIGYKFSDTGLFIHVTDKKAQNFYVFLTDDIDKMMQIMMLPEPNMAHIFASPENFVQWILQSPKFDSKLFREHGNHRSHRDAKTDPFCNAVYTALQSTEVSASVPPVRIDFNQGEPDLDQKLQVEKKILSKDVVQDILDQIEARSKVETPVISGQDLMNMGFKPGPLFGEIIKDVSKKFDVEDDIDMKKQYILDNWGHALA